MADATGALTYGFEGTPKGTRGRPLLHHGTGNTMKRVIVTLDGGNYRTGGVSISGVWDLFGRNVTFIIALPTGGYVFEPDLTNKKLKMFRQSGATGPLAELPDNTIAVSNVVTLLAVGY